MNSSQSTHTLQNLADNLLIRGDLKPILTAGGFNTNLITDIATDVMAAFCDTTVPWKWNEMQLVPFYTNSLQQDYALDVTNLAWLTDGIAIQINNSSVPKPWTWVEVGRQQGRSTATTNIGYVASPQFTCSWLPNNLLYFGTWGAAETGTGSWGNNPQAHQLISNPLGADNSTPANPICQIQDANGNLLVVTTYGTTGATPPVLPALSDAGTTVLDGGVTWTVIDPFGQGIRVKPVPSSTGTVWQFNLTAQMKPVIFDPQISLNQQTLFPLTDDYYSQFRQGCVAQAYLYSPEDKQRKKGEDMWARWVQTVNALSLQAAKQQGERERDLDCVIPASTVLGAGTPGGGWRGPANPFMEI